MTLDDLAVFTVYMGFFSVFIGAVAFLEWITERVPFLNRLMNRWLDSMKLNDEEDWEYDDTDC